MAQLKNTTISDTRFLQLPVGTTAQRPASPTNGMTRYNTSDNTVEYYNGTGWIQISNENDATVTGAYTLDIIDAGIPYRVHVFTGSGTFVPRYASEVEYLIVAGGGGGGQHHGGGGGGGGFLTGTTTVTPQTYTITVGSGGAGTLSNNTTNPVPGANGQNSIAFGLTAIGGGGGGSWAGNGTSGGSGGGASNWTVNPARLAGAGTPGQGFAGANSVANTTDAGGGGGGAGGSPIVPSGLDGGPGRGSTITGTLTYYAGGGASGRYLGGNFSGGIGGRGGGGRGSWAFGDHPQGANYWGGFGGANTGGGGGGAASLTTPGRGGNGGSGVVIVRYRKHTNQLSNIPSIVTTNLQWHVNAGNPESYSGANATVWYDVSGNNRNGTLNGTLPFYRNNHGGYFDFNGSNNNVTIPNAAIPTGNLLTFEVWNYGLEVRSSSVIEATIAGGSRSLNVHLPWSSRDVFFDCGGNRLLRLSDSWLDFLGWHHWVFTKNASTGVMRIYLDGNLWASSTGNTGTIAATTAARLGSYANNSNYHRAYVGEARLYNRDLTAEEVLRNFQATRGRYEF